jgi:hypothetical protein
LLKEFILPSQGVGVGGGVVIEIPLVVVEIMPPFEDAEHRLLFHPAVLKSDEGLFRLGQVLLQKLTQFCGL